MSPIAVEILVIFSLILLNGVFALAEIAVVASRKARLQRLAEKGNARARAALQLAEAPADFLSTVQVGITLIGVLSGAFAGATIAEQLAVAFADLPLIGPHAETAAIALVVVAITYLALILGELVPKRIALNNPERISTFIARLMRGLSRFALPIVRLLSASSDAVLWLLRVRPSAEPSITEEEVRILIRQGAVAGEFAKPKQELIERVFRLGSLQVRAIMTPRRDIVPLLLTDSVEAIAGKLRTDGHSHYPLCDGSLENVLGIVTARDLLQASLAEGRLDLGSAAREAPNIPENTSALKALELLKTSGSQVALVVDEFGVLQGIVTMYDFAGALVGLFPNEERPGITPRKDGSLLVDGMLPIGDLQEVIKLPKISEEESHAYATVGGYLLARMGRIPIPGDSVAIGEFRMEILDMDGLRIDKVLVSRLNRPPHTPPAPIVR